MTTFHGEWVSYVDLRRAITTTGLPLGKLWRRLSFEWSNGMEPWHRTPAKRRNCLESKVSHSGDNGRTAWSGGVGHHARRHKYGRCRLNGTPARGWPAPCLWSRWRQPFRIRQKSSLKTACNEYRCHALILAGSVLGCSRCREARRLRLCRADRYTPSSASPRWPGGCPCEPPRSPPDMLGFGPGHRPARPGRRGRVPCPGRNTMLEQSPRSRDAAELKRMRVTWAARSWPGPLPSPGLLRLRCVARRSSRRSRCQAGSDRASGSLRLAQMVSASSSRSFSGSSRA